MHTMDATASFDQFTELAEQDGKVFVALLQASKDIASWWLRIFLLIFFIRPVFNPCAIRAFYLP